MPSTKEPIFGTQLGNLSDLPKTWLIDLDGTIVEHNGYLSGQEKLLPGIKRVLEEIPDQDKIIILTARSSSYETQTKEFLSWQGIKFDQILFDLPVGERILINDKKPSGLLTAYAINIKRNANLSQNQEPNL